MKNPLTEFCVDCLEEWCTEIDQTHFIIEKIDKSTFKIRPSRKILNKNVD